MFGDDPDPTVMTERVGFGTGFGRARKGVLCIVQRGSDGRTTKNGWIEKRQRRRGGTRQLRAHYRKQLLCRLPRRTAKARKADGKDLCRQPRTAKGSGKEGYGKQLLCRLLPGGGRQRLFAVCGGWQRGRTAIFALSVR